MNAAIKKWWDGMTFEEKFYKVIAANVVLTGDTVDNHPDKISFADITKVYIYHHK